MAARFGVGSERLKGLGTARFVPISFPPDGIRAFAIVSARRPRSWMRNCPMVLPALVPDDPFAPMTDADGPVKLFRPVCCGNLAHPRGKEYPGIVVVITNGKGFAALLCEDCVRHHGLDVARLPSYPKEIPSSPAPLQTRHLHTPGQGTRSTG